MLFWCRLFSRAGFITVGGFSNSGRTLYFTQVFKFLFFRKRVRRRELVLISGGQLSRVQRRLFVSVGRASSVEWVVVCRLGNSCGWDGEGRGAADACTGERRPGAAAVGAACVRRRLRPRMTSVVWALPVVATSVRCIQQQYVASVACRLPSLNPPRWSWFRKTPLASRSSIDSAPTEGVRKLQIQQWICHQAGWNPDES